MNDEGIVCFAYALKPNHISRDYADFMVFYHKDRRAQAIKWLWHPATEE
jgi:hypothetical protein